MEYGREMEGGRERLHLCGGRRRRRRRRRRRVPTLDGVGITISVVLCCSNFHLKFISLSFSFCGIHAWSIALTSSTFIFRIILFYSFFSLFSYFFIPNPILSTFDFPRLHWDPPQPSVLSHSSVSLTFSFSPLSVYSKYYIHIL